MQIYTPSDQAKIIDRWSLQGSYRLMALLHRRQHEVIALSRHRLLSLGFEQYGDAMFHQTLTELERESLEELADGVNRQAVYSWLEAGQP